MIHEFQSPRSTHLSIQSYMVGPQASHNHTPAQKQLVHAFGIMLLKAGCRVNQHRVKAKYVWGVADYFWYSAYNNIPIV